MNVFRLFLCLAGLVMFLVIRNLSPQTPPKTSASHPPPDLNLPAFPQVETTPELSIDNPQPIDSVDFQGTIVSFRHGPDGVRFDLATHGTNLGFNLSERQFEEQHPNLYGLVQRRLKAR